MIPSACGPRPLSPRCGTSPIPASSSEANHRRLNQIGDRRAKAALHRIVAFWLHHDEQTDVCRTCRIGKGVTKAEVIRYLKVYEANESFAVLRQLVSQKDAKQA